MDELDKALAISLDGAAAEEAVSVMVAQLDQWGMSLPSAAPIVCDFGLGDFARIGEVEVWIANEVTEGYCGKFLFVQDGQTCPRHTHLSKHETFFIVKGCVAMTFGDRSMELGEGDVLPVPQGTYHSFTGKGPALLLEVSCPCIIEDNYFEDRGIPIGGNYQNG